MANIINKPQGKAQECSFMAGGQEVKLSLSTVKNYLVSGDASKVTDQECVMFINLCKYNGLNPFLKEAYLIKYGSSPATMVPGKEAFTKRAERNENFDGMKAGVVVVIDGEVIKRDGSAVYTAYGEELLGGWAEVYRKDRKHPFYAEVALSEYNTGKSKWASSPATMIRKVALVQALREAFPGDLGAMYSAEEQHIEEPDIVSEVRLADAPAANVEPVESDDPFGEVE